MIVNQKDWWFIASWVLLAVGLFDGGWLLPLFGAICGYQSMKKGGNGKLPMMINIIVAVLIILIYSVLSNFLYY